MRRVLIPTPVLLLLPVLLLMLAAATAAVCQTAADTPEVSVVVVADLSYSMRLVEEPPLRRADMLERGLVELLGEPSQGVEWALVAFEDAGSIHLRRSFTRDARRLAASVRGLKTSRLSPISTALDFAADYLLDHGSGRTGAVLLVSDGVATEGQSFQIRLGPRFREELIPLYILGFSHTHNPALRESLARLSDYTGGAYFTFDQIDSLRGAIRSRPIQPDAEALLGSVDPAINDLRFAGPAFAAAVGPGRTVAVILLLGVGLIAAGLLWNRRIRRVREDGGGRPAGPARMSITICFPDGRTRRIRTRRSRVTIGDDPECDVRLSVRGGRDCDLFTYSWDADGALFESSRPFLLNGVARMSKVLKRGDVLKYGEHKLTFEGVDRELPAVEPVRNLTVAPVSAGVFLVFASFLLASVQSLRGPSAVDQPPPSVAVRGGAHEGAREVAREGAHESADWPEPQAQRPSEARPARSSAPRSGPRAEPRRDAEPQREAGSSHGAGSSREAGSSHGAQPPRASEPRRVEPASNPAPDPPPAVQKMETSGRAVYSRALAPPVYPKRPLAKRPVHVVPPGQTPTFFKADILFIHAHPDDEALDFAGLMAKAARHGKRVVTVLFTDGESGLDQFPHRCVDGTHPDRNLNGEALANVRVNEARSALSYLGTELYIRFGLKNHPYNTEVDVLPDWTIYHHWGTKRLLEERVRILLEGFRPDVVVSSDYRSEAYEHFEHKAVGKAVRRVVSRVRSSGRGFPRGYLVSVDPFQRPSLHPWIERLDMMRRDEETGLTYREIQCAALKEHRTQGDASLIGVELLPNFRWEKYAPVFWNTGLTLEAYAAGR